MLLRLAASAVTVLLVATPLVAQPAPEPPAKGPPGKGPPPGEKGPPPPKWEGPAKGAHFKLKRGGDNIDVKCADDEPVKACVDATASLIDRVWGRK